MTIDEAYIYACKQVRARVLKYYPYGCSQDIEERARDAVTRWLVRSADFTRAQSEIERAICLRAHGAIIDAVRALTGYRTHERTGAPLRYFHPIHADLDESNEVLRDYTGLSYDDTQLSRAENKEEMAAVFKGAKLNPRETVVLQKYLAGFTLREVSKQEGLTESRMCQILKSARAKIRETIKRRERGA